MTTARLRALRWGVGVTAASVFVTVYTIGHWGLLRRLQIQMTSHSPLATSDLGVDAGLYAARMLALFAGVALASAFIAVKTKDPIVWAVPVLAFVGIPWLTWFIGQEPGTPMAIGHLSHFWTWTPWQHALFDLSLILAPGAVVAATTPRDGPRVGWGERIVFVCLGSLGLALALQDRFVETGQFRLNLDVDMPLAFLFMVGAALGVRRPWFPWVHLMTAICLSTLWFPLTDWLSPLFSHDVPIPHQVRVVWGSVKGELAAIGLGSAVLPLASYLRTRRRGTRRVPAPLPHGA